MRFRLGLAPICPADCDSPGAARRVPIIARVRSPASCSVSFVDERLAATSERASRLLVNRLSKYSSTYVLLLALDWRKNHAAVAASSTLSGRRWPAPHSSLLPASTEATHEFRSLALLVASISAALAGAGVLPQDAPRERCFCAADADAAATTASQQAIPVYVYVCVSERATERTCT